MNSLFNLGLSSLRSGSVHEVSSVWFFAESRKYTAVTLYVPRGEFLATGTRTLYVPSLAVPLTLLQVASASRALSPVRKLPWLSPMQEVVSAMPGPSTLMEFWNWL